VLFTKSPGGALATAARVASFRPLIDRVSAGTGIDPNFLEGIVFLESAGRPDVIAAPIRPRRRTDPDPRQTGQVCSECTSTWPAAAS